MTHAFSSRLWIDAWRLTLRKSRAKLASPFLVVAVLSFGSRLTQAEELSYYLPPGTNYDSTIPSPEKFLGYPLEIGTFVPTKSSPITGSWPDSPIASKSTNMVALMRIDH